MSTNAPKFVTLGTAPSSVMPSFRAATSREPRRLLVRSLGHLGHGAERRAGAEGAVRFPVRDDRGGAPLAEARDVAQQARGRAVTVDTDVRDARDEGFVQGAGERELVDVVLILSDADRPGLDLHQLRERVLQAAGD